MLRPTDNGAYVVFHRLGLTTGAPGPYRVHRVERCLTSVLRCSLALVIPDGSEMRRSHE
jgi:hypothetical protein